VFLFNSLNYYFPLIYIAFDPRNNQNYDELFQLLLTQLAVKQITMSMIDYLKPLLTVHYKVKKL
jgi:hypothetical protein